MSNKTTSKLNTIALVSLLFLFVLSFQVAAADDNVIVDHDFVVSTYELRSDFFFSVSATELSACRCDTVPIYLTIQNRGTFTESFTIQTDNPSLVFTEPAVLLNQGEQRIIIGYLTAPCQAPDSQDTTILITAASGLQKQAIIPINYLDCQNLAISLGQDEISTELCTLATNELTILNTGNHPETYVVGVDNLREYIGISTNTVSLAPQASVSLPIEYRFDCGIYGEQQIEYTVTAQGSQLEAKTIQTVNINPNYNFTVSAEANILSCSEDRNEYSIAVINSNVFANEFTLDLDAPSFMRLGNETIILEGGQATQIPLVVDPINKPGSYNVSVFITSTLGDVTQELNMIINLSNCYEFSSDISLPPKRIAACGTDQFNYTIGIEHLGAQDTEIDLIVDGPEYVYVVNERPVLPANATTEFPIFFDIPRGINETNDVIVSAFHRGEQIDSGKFTLLVDDEHLCYELTQKKDTIKVRFDETGFGLPVKNTGDRYGVYIQDLNKQPSYLSLAGGDLVAIDVSETEYINFSISEFLLQYEAFNQNNGSIIGMTVDVELALTHTESGADFAFPLTIEFVDYTWWQKAAGKVIDFASYWWSVIIALPVCIIILGIIALISLLLLLSLLVQRIVGKRVFKLRKGFALVVAILWLLVVGATLITIGLPTGEELFTVYDLSQDTTTYIQLVEDTNKKVDLSEFFFDPDMDIETYGVYSIDQGILKYKVRNEILTLKPGKDYFGITSMQVFATDAFNETAVSDQITIEVLPLEDYTPKQLLYIFCDYIALIGLLIFALLLVWVASMRSRE